MGKTSFQNINDLAISLAEQIKKINTGHLSVKDLEAAVNQAKDIYERLIVLRHKAYEKFGEPQTNVVEPVKENVKEVEIKPIDFTAFEDESAKKVSAPKVVKPSLPDVGFDFTQDDAPIEKTEAPVVAQEVKKPLDVVRAEIKSESKSMHENFAKEELPLNEKLKQDSDLPLRKKLQIKPISDLRSEIGIGKKFEYINFLFGGDSKAYEAGIDALNACQSGEEAKQKLNDFGSQYNWNFEEKSIIKFVELVELKFK